jgi:hypothetical protein
MPLATGGGTPLTLNASLQASLKISSGDAPAAAVAGSGTVAQLVGKFECGHILMDRSLLARFMADGDEIALSVVPSSLKAAMSWGRCFSDNTADEVEISQPVALGHAVFFMREIEKLHERIKELNAAPMVDGDAVAHAFELLEEFQMRANGFLHLAYDHGNIAAMLNMINLKSARAFLFGDNAFTRLAIFSKYMPVFDRKMRSNDEVRKKIMGNRTALILAMRPFVLEAIFGKSVRQRDNDATCYSTGVCATMQVSHPLFLLRCAISMFGFGDCVGLPCLDENGAACEVDINCNENSANLNRDGKLCDEDHVRSLHRVFIRTFADTLSNWPSRFSSCKDALLGIRDVLSGINAGHLQIFNVNENDSIGCNTLGKSAGAISRNMGVAEASGVYAAKFTLNGEERFASPDALIKLRDTIFDTVSSIQKIDARTDQSPNFVALRNAMEKLTPFIDGEENATLLGGYTDVLLRSIYQTHEIIRLNQKNDAPMAEDLFRIIYESIVSYANETGKLPPAKFTISGVGHTYTANAYLLLPYIIAGMDWRAALEKAVEMRLPVINPNWMLRQLIFCADDGGKCVARSVQFSGTAEDGTPISYCTREIAQGSGSCKFLSERITVYPPLEVPK